MATISFNGLASGLDTKAIVDQLTQVKQAQIVTPVSNSLNLAKSRKTALGPISTALSSLKNSAKTLNNADNAAYSSKTTESSNTDIVKASNVDSTNAVNGTYNITNITRLAQPDRVIFEGVANTNVTQFGVGTINITYKGLTHSIVIDSSNNTLDGLKSAINDASAGVTASIISDGSPTAPYRLVLTSNDSGADSTITHDLNSVLSLTVDASSTDSSNEPQDASFLLNSVPFLSSSNSVTDAIPGVTFNLLGTNPTGTVTLTVKQDVAGIIANIQSFISSLNSARDSLKKAIDPDANNKFGPLGHDNMLQEVYYEVGRLSATQVLSAGAYVSLASIGITADRKGVYTIDNGKLTTALEADVSVIRKIFQGTTAQDGIAESIYNYTDTLTNPLGTFATRQKQYDDSISRLNKLLKDRNQLLSNYNKKIKDQFNKLETKISALKGQQDQLTGLANTISGVGNN